MGKTRYVLDYNVSIIKEDNFGQCVGSCSIARTCCEINKEQSAKFLEYVVSNELTEFHKNKVKVINDG